MLEPHNKITRLEIKIAHARYVASMQYEKMCSRNNSQQYNYARTHAKNARTRAKITTSGRRGRGGKAAQQTTK